MTGRVVQAFAGVTGLRYDFAVAHDDCADRNVAFIKRKTRLMKRKTHHFFVKLSEQAVYLPKCGDLTDAADKSIIPQKRGLYKRPWC